MKRRRSVVLALLVVLLVVIAASVTYLLVVPSSSPSPLPGPTGLAVCPTSPGNGTSGNWTTYHQANSRAGVESLPDIHAAQARWSTPVGLDGQVYAEPLVCGASLFVATEDDSVYAINATSGATLWRTHLGTPLPGSSLPCGDINPSGITGTPVVDAASGTLYAVAFLSPGQHVLFGINVVNGSVESQAVVDPLG